MHRRQLFISVIIFIIIGAIAYQFFNAFLQKKDVSNSVIKNIENKQNNNMANTTAAEVSIKMHGTSVDETMALQREGLSWQEQQMLVQPKGGTNKILKNKVLEDLQKLYQSLEILKQKHKFTKNLSAAEKKQIQQQQQILAQRFIESLKQQRQKWPRQVEHDEIYLDTLQLAMESFVDEKDWTPKNCSKFKNRLLRQFEPTAIEQPIEPGVKEAFQILQALCF